MSGYAPSACSSRLVAAGETPPCASMKVNWFRGWGKDASNVAVEIATSAKGEPPRGSSKTPMTVSASVLPVAVSTRSREPRSSPWSSA